MLERLRVDQALGVAGQRIAHEVQATECTYVGSNETYGAYIIHGVSGDVRYLADGGYGVLEGEEDFDGAWAGVTGG